MRVFKAELLLGIAAGQRLDMARGYLENYFQKLSPVDSLHKMALVLGVLDRSCQHTLQPL